MPSRPGKVRLKATVEELLSAGTLLPDPIRPARLDLPAVFGNARSVEIEVGPGKGAFLLARAAARPDLNLLGVEWVRSYALYAADRARRRGRFNVRLLCADAATVFEKMLPELAIWRVHIYFPDPWPKRRHRRRRLLTPAFLKHVCRALRLGGWVGVITDHAEYFRRIRAALGVTTGLAAVPFQAPAGAGDWLVGSNFEKKYAISGRPFHAAAAIRFR